MNSIQKTLVVTVLLFASGCAASTSESFARRPPMIGAPNFAALPAVGNVPIGEARPLRSIETVRRPHAIAARRSSGLVARTMVRDHAGRDCPQCR